MVFCANCGAEIKNPETQNFCEKCGSTIPTSVKEGRTEETATTAPVSTTKITTMGFEPYDHPGGLFDLSRNYYILKEKYWDWGSGEILDENNQVIGKMRRVILSIRRRVELLEIDGTLSATIHSKIVSARGAQDLKDPQGNLVARIKKKILSVFRPKFFLESPTGERFFEAQGKFMGWSYKVTDMSGKLIAEIEKADRWRDVFLGGLLDFKDTYALRILDNETDRRILLGFVLSIDNVLHDY
ncbi:MAG: LURP-one-related family protein [Candidatus Thorarchaeota archaeon]